jgi:hypothetical protein
MPYSLQWIAGAAMIAAGIWLLLRLIPQSRALDEGKRFAAVADKANPQNARR